MVPEPPERSLTRPPLLLPDSLWKSHTSEYTPHRKGLTAQEYRVVGQHNLCVPREAWLTIISGSRDMIKLCIFIFIFSFIFFCCWLSEAEKSWNASNYTAYKIQPYLKGYFRLPPEGTNNPSFPGRISYDKYAQRKFQLTTIDCKIGKL